MTEMTESKIKVKEITAWTSEFSAIHDIIRIELPNGMKVNITFSDYENTKYGHNDDLRIRIHKSSRTKTPTDVEVTTFTDSKVTKKKTASGGSVWTDVRTTMEGR